ncbi:MAG: hypothetical protein ACEQSB_04440 [Undibacterium sp.]
MFRGHNYRHCIKVCQKKKKARVATATRTPVLPKQWSPLVDVELADVDPGIELVDPDLGELLARHDPRRLAADADDEVLADIAERDRRRLQERTGTAQVHPLGITPMQVTDRLILIHGIHHHSP